MTEDKIIPISDLIYSLEHTTLNSVSKTFLASLVKMRKDYQDSKDKEIICVDIDTDDDFAVNNAKMILGSYYGEEIVKDGESYHSALLRYIDKLELDVENNRIAKRFVEMIKSPHFEESLNLLGFVFDGGNQTINVEVKTASEIVDFSDIRIDLSR